MWAWATPWLLGRVYPPLLYPKGMTSSVGSPTGLLGQQRCTRGCQPGTPTEDTCPCSSHYYIAYLPLQASCEVQRSASEVIDFSSLTTTTSSLLNLGIMAVLFVPKFRTVRFPEYSGSTDPVQYTRVYEVEEQVAGRGEAFTTKSFLLTLMDTIQAWYLGLGPRSMHSWKNLRDILHDHLHGSRNREMMSSDLNNLESFLDETIRAVQKHFLDMQWRVNVVN